MSGLVVGALVAAAVWRVVVRRPFPLRDPVEVGRVVPVRSIRVRRRPSSTADRAPARAPARARAGLADDAVVDLAGSVDLLAVAVDAGSTVPLAVAVVGDSGDGPTARALRSVTAATLRGTDFVTALEELDRSLGRSGRELRISLTSGVTSGTPVGPSLRRLADQVRLRRRRLVEQRIRRLPVLLLIPLCVLLLPAFVLLTLAPVGIATVADLDLNGSLGDPGSGDVGPVDVGSGQLGPGELGPVDIGSGEFDPGEPGVVRVGPP